MNPSVTGERENVADDGLEPLRDKYVASTGESGVLEPLMTERRYCDITGESLATARRNRQLGRGCRFVKLGFLIRYRPSDVRDYIDQHLRTITTKTAPKAKATSSTEASQPRGSVKKARALRERKSA